MQDTSNLKWILERQLHWISSADSKLAVVASMPLAMLAISLFDISERLGEFGWIDLPLILSSVFLCVSLFFTKAALTPRLSGPPESIIYFGEINKLSAEEYDKKVSVFSEKQFVQDLTNQIHRNSEIAAIKHKNVSVSIFWLTLAAPFWILSIAVG